jgi:TnpA family transposase
LVNGQSPRTARGIAPISPRFGPSWVDNNIFLPRQPQLYNNTTDIQPSIHSTDTHGTNEVNFAILAFFGYQFAPRCKDIHGKMETLDGFKHPSQYDKKFLLKPTSKANTKLIIAEEDNIQHILASLALKVTRQSVIIAKLSSYPRRN